MTALVGVGLVGLAIVSHGQSEGFQNFSVYVAVYSVAAYGSQRDALRGFAVGATACVVFTVVDANVRSGRVGDLWAGAFFLLLLVVAWLAGLVVRHVRTRRVREREAAAREQAAVEAAAAERSRLAHELHDIVSHNLSVVVLQAAGAQAQANNGSSEALEKIERSGRQALVEMRRLLGVLRTDDPKAGAPIAPQPGIADVQPLVDNVRAAGLPITLSLSGEMSAMAPAVQLAVYRIVQEALTNALKHAPGASTEVVVKATTDEVTIDVTDAGTEQAPTGGDVGGHGLVGMRERIELFGGSIVAGPRPGGGFSVHAQLPIEEPQS